MSREVLDKHKELWKKKEITRYLYTKWFNEMKSELSPLFGPSVELGAGIGNFKEFMPSSIASDIIYCEWVDIVHNAQALPYKTGSIVNFILMDAIHHMANPIAVIDEMHRCLKKNGRIIIYDIYISMFSYLYYNYFHREEVDLAADVYNLPTESKEKDPFSSNQAISTLLFYKHWNRFVIKYPKLKFIKREVKEFLLYPLSGGFEGRQLIPFKLAGLVEWIDRYALEYFGNKIAARCFVVLEKQ